MECTLYHTILPSTACTFYILNFFSHVKYTNYYKIRKLLHTKILQKFLTHLSITYYYYFPGEICQHCQKEVDQKEELHNVTPHIIGSWTVNEDERIDRSLFCTKKSCKEWLELELLHPYSLTARVYTDFTKDTYSCSTCILFDPDDLQKSYYIQELTHSESGSLQLTSELPCPVIKIVRMVYTHSNMLIHWENDHSMAGYFVPSSCLDTCILDWIAALFILPLRILCFLLPSWFFW